MRRRTNVLLCAILLCLTPAAAHAQQPDANQITNGHQLIDALFGVCRGDLSCGATVLGNHKDLITEELWRRLIATGDSNRLATPVSYGLALEVASKLDNKSLLGSTYYKLGWYQFGQGNIDGAIENYLKSKSFFEAAGLKRDLIYVLADLGSLYIYASDYKTAKLYSQEGLKLAKEVESSDIKAGAWPDEYGVGTALSNLGNISRRDGDYDKATDYFQQSLVAYKRIDAGTGRFRVEILDDLADIGRTYSASGDSLRALSFLNQAMALAKDSDREAGIYNSLGILYTNQRDYAKAIELFQQGLKVALQRRDRYKQAELWLNIGVAYQFQQNNESALNSFQQAMEVAKQINYSELIVPIYEGRGAVLKAQGKYNDALEVLTEGLERAKSLGDKTRIAELLWRQSEVNLASGELTESIANSSEAVNRAEQLSLRNVRYLALTTLGKAYRARGENDLAMQTFQKATTLIEEMRTQVAGLENERQLFFEDKVVPYHEIVDMLLSQKNDESIQRALLIAESAKARVLLDVFSAGRVDLARVMSDRERERRETQSAHSRFEQPDHSGKWKSQIRCRDS